jgi:shikimate dehydrogenase
MEESAMNESTHFALFGNPVAQSLSPLMHSAAFAKMEFMATYTAYQVNDAAEIVRMIREKGIKGASVTIPFKETVMAFLDEVDANASEIGAVNTIINRDGKLIGYNTDGPGLIRDLAEWSAIRGKTFIILGAGGAARAAVHALATLGASRISVLNRSTERAARLVADLRPLFPGVSMLAGESAASAGEIDLVLNARPASVPVDASEFDLAPGAVACDLAYRPEITPFLRTMMDSGARPVGGLGMLVHQAAASLEYWTGRLPSTDAMFAAARRALADPPADTGH